MKSPTHWHFLSHKLHQSLSISLFYVSLHLFLPFVLFYSQSNHVQLSWGLFSLSDGCEKEEESGAVYVQFDGHKREYCFHLAPSADKDKQAALPK